MMIDVANAKRENLSRLTPREKTVLLALARSMGANKEVAAGVGLGVGTVKAYIVGIRSKLRAQGFDVNSRYRLITWAKEHQAELENMVGGE